jgi:hypothetical protein
LFVFVLSGCAASAPNPPGYREHERCHFVSF